MHPHRPCTHDLALCHGDCAVKLGLYAALYACETCSCIQCHPEMSSLWNCGAEVVTEFSVNTTIITIIQSHKGDNTTISVWMGFKTAYKEYWETCLCAWAAFGRLKTFYDFQTIKVFKPIKNRFQYQTKYRDSKSAGMMHPLKYPRNARHDVGRWYKLVGVQGQTFRLFPEKIRKIASFNI